MRRLSKKYRTLSSSGVTCLLFAGLMIHVAATSLGLVPAGQLNDADGSIFLHGGQLIDPRDGTVRRANLLIVNGVVAGTPDRLPRDFAGSVLDVTGRFIVPGLRDLHVHSMVQGLPDGPPEMLGSNVAARRMAQVGVLGFLDLLHVEHYIFGMRDEQRDGLRQHRGRTVPGADIFAAGAVLTAPGGHGTEYGLPARLLENPEDARRHVAELAELDADVVKIVYEHPTAGMPSWRPTLPTITRPALEAAVQAARSHCLKTVVHIRSWQDVRDVALAGASAITHLPSEPMPDDLPAILAEQRTRLIPTLARGDLGLLEADALADPILAHTAGDHVVDAYRRWDRESEGARGMISGLDRAQRHRFEALARLHQAGVPIIAGTDSGNSWTVHGYSLHRELELMVEAGMEPAAALRAATVEAGRLLGRPWGLARGDEGSVLVLASSPLEDIRATRQVEAVIHHGRRVELSRELIPPDPRISMGG